jgi:hypothetical protein
MKNFFRLFLVVTVTSSIFLFFGCGLSSKAVVKNHVYDVSIPEEETCILKYSARLTVVQFNEIKVNWNSIWRDGSVVKIPAGEHTLIVNYESSTRMGSYIRTQTADGLTISHEFHSGKTYELIPLIGGNRIALIINEL